MLLYDLQTDDDDIMLGSSLPPTQHNTTVNGEYYQPALKGNATTHGQRLSAMNAVIIKIKMIFL